MKSAVPYLFGVFLSLVFTSHGFGQTKCEDACTLLESLNKWHISPPTLDDSFKKVVLKAYTNELDPQDLYFSKSEVDKIISFPLKLEKKETNVCGLAQLAASILQSQLIEFKSFLNTTLSRPLEYKSEEFFTYEINHSAISSEGKLALSKRRKRWVKFLTLMRMYHEASINKSNNLLDYEKKSRERVLARELNDIDKLLNDPKGLDDFATQIFFKTLATSFDPHTEFFTVGEMKNFKSSLSTKKFSWGLDFTEDKMGQATINHIEPGSTAWNSNAIHQDDVLINLSFNDGVVSDAFDYSSEELNQLLSHSDKNKVEITIRRKDGKLDTVKLEKTEIETQENKVKSFLLKGDKKVGYISLPAFYTDWDNPVAKGCANDVAKELVKLKKENISGLILDLRFNGGGIVSEAVDLAGIFIDFGPLMILQSKDVPPLVLKDISKGVAYSGPLLILINGFSASASELVAAALQDYKRAIIVGTKSFGKSTSQSFFPIVNQDTIGFAKITMEKVYRITGKSHQLAGVKPDITLPDFTDLFGYSERSYKNPLPADTIVKKVYFTPWVSPPIKELKIKSERRVSVSNSFQHIKIDHDSFSLAVPLDMKRFVEYISKAGNQEYNKSEETKSFQVSPTQFDNQILQVDAYAKEINDALLIQIEQSPYVDEAFKILIDYLNSSKK